MTDKLATLRAEDRALDLPPPPDTTGLPEALRADVDAAFSFQAATIAPATRRAYQSAWRRFLAWSRERGLPTLPSTPEAVATYAAHLAASGKKYSTIVGALAAIGAAHDATALDPNPAHARVVRQQLRGIARTIGRLQTRKRAIVDAEIRRMATLFPATALGKRDRALLLLSFICAARRSEPVALDIADLDFREEGLYVLFRRTKTDQEGVGMTKAVPYSSSAAICPVRAVKAWIATLHEHGFDTGPLFRAVRGSDGVQPGRLSAGAAAARVKRYAELIGIAAAQVSGHSLRSGFATSAARKGRPERAIMATTGHKLFDTVLKYIREANLMRDSAAVGVLDE